MQLLDTETRYIQLMQKYLYMNILNDKNLIDFINNYFSKSYIIGYKVMMSVNENKIISFNVEKTDKIKMENEISTDHFSYNNCQTLLILILKIYLNISYLEDNQYKKANEKLLSGIAKKLMLAIVEYCKNK